MHDHQPAGSTSSSIHLAADILLSLIALLCTMVELIGRAGIYLCKATLGLLVRLLCVALLAGLFLAGSFLLAGLQMVGGGINSNLS